MEGFKFEEQKEKEIGKQIFLMTPEKLKKQKLQEFMQQYNFYINRLLIAKSDPFIEQRNKCYLRKLEFDKLEEIQKVFERLQMNASKKLKPENEASMRRR